MKPQRDFKDWLDRQSAPKWAVMLLGLIILNLVLIYWL